MSAGRHPLETLVYPTRDAVHELVGEGRRVPVSHTWIADCETPVGAYLKLRDDEPAFLLESAEQGRLGRHSMLGGRPEAVLRSKDGRMTCTWNDGRVDELDAADPFVSVQRVVDGVGMVRPPGRVPPFLGGAVGYFGYDLVRTTEHLPNRPPDALGVPDLLMMLTGPIVTFDHLDRTITVTVPCALEGDVDAAFDAAVEKIEALKDELMGPIPRSVNEAPGSVGEVVGTLTQAEYEDVVERCREYVFAGDVFQVVPSLRFTAETTLDPFAIFRGLRAVNPSPYMFFLAFPEVSLAGSSPELLVKVEGSTVATRPIAGTRPRGETDEEDRRLAEELVADPKERAEHVMLVDLGRNDIGRVSRTGTVRVSDLMSVERYSHVMHIESSVCGELREGTNAADALRAVFPAGTLSGAPKVRAMEIIDEMEPTARGTYGGAVGFIGFDGDMDTCITIRTALCADGLVHVQAGAGIVADSVPSVEYQEARNKARGMLQAIEVAASQEDW